MDSAFHATKATTLKMEPVFSPPQTLLQLMILDAELGMVQSVSSAPLDGSLIRLDLAFLSTIYAALTTLTESVLLVILAILWLKEAANSLKSFYLMLVVLDGTYPHVHALPALLTGFSTKMESVFQSVTLAELTTTLDFAQDATEDTKS